SQDLDQLLRDTDANLQSLQTDVDYELHPNGELEGVTPKSDAKSKFPFSFCPSKSHGGVQSPQDMSEEEPFEGMKESTQQPESEYADFDITADVDAFMSILNTTQPESLPRTTVASQNRQIK